METNSHKKTLKIKSKTDAIGKTTDQQKHNENAKQSE